jgi:hypothetical protein
MCRYWRRVLCPILISPISAWKRRKTMISCGKKLLNLCFHPFWYLGVTLRKVSGPPGIKYGKTQKMAGEKIQNQKYKTHLKKLVVTNVQESCMDMCLTLFHPQLPSGTLFRSVHSSNVPKTAFQAKFQYRRSRRGMVEIPRSLVVKSC